MDADRLSALLRFWGTAPTRRDLTRALSGTALAAPLATLLGTFTTDAKKKRKKKKKKCKGGKKKCGKRCIPKTSCCPDATCGGNGVCQSGACACFAEFRLCKGTCIPDGNCCINADCEGGGVCSNGECRCLDGFKVCGEACIPENDCCTDADCGDACTTCQGGACTGGCSADETCLANGSCGKTCTFDHECYINPPNPTCACAAEDDGDPVCRELIGSGLTCDALPVCTTTADCPEGSVCGPNCSPSRCIPLCDL